MSTRPPSPRPPGAPRAWRRVAGGAWHVVGGFAFLLRRPALWPLALAPVLVTALLLFLGLILGLFGIRAVESTFASLLARLPEWADLIVTLALWAGTLVAGLLLGLAVALLLTAPLCERLSRRVERLAGGATLEADKGWRWEVLQSLRGALYFLAAAPGILLLNLVPVLGPLAGALWGAHALAHQLTDAPLTRRGLDFRARRAWHRAWRAESLGFGLAALVALVVPAANLLLGPALAVGGTLLVIELGARDAPASDGPEPQG